MPPAARREAPVKVVGGAAGHRQAMEIARRLDIPPTGARVASFPDGESDVAVDAAVAGCDVYVVHSLAPPANDRLVELLLMLDACRRAGADRVTAVIPYLAYARKDRRTSPGEAVSLRVAADMVKSAGAHRAVLVDPHVAQSDSVFPIPLEVVSAVPLLAAALEPTLPEDAIVVAPDVGAVDLAERYAAALGLEGVGLVRKARRSGTEVDVTGLVGDGRGRPVLLVDDMITTGATLQAAADVVLAEWSPPSLYVAATHGLFVGDAVNRLARLPLSALVVSDSVSGPARPPLCQAVGLDGVLAEAIARLHDPRS